MVSEPEAAESQHGWIDVKLFWLKLERWGQVLLFVHINGGGSTLVREVSSSANRNQNSNLSLKDALNLNQQCITNQSRCFFSVVAPATFSSHTQKRHLQCQAINKQSKYWKQSSVLVIFYTDILLDKCQGHRQMHNTQNKPTWGLWRANLYMTLRCAVIVSRSRESNNYKAWKESRRTGTVNKFRFDPLYNCLSFLFCY